MANQGQNVSYRPGVSRAITRKWAEAKAINYDEWDDSDGYDPEEPVQTVHDHGRQPSWDTRSQGAGSQAGYSNPPNQYYPSNRSVTGPGSSTGRPSFDRGDERRHFSNVGGAQGPYPTAQRDPFEEVQHDYDPSFNPQMQGHRTQPSLQLHTGGRPSIDQGQYPQGPYTAGPRVQHYQDSRGAPFSAPIIGPSGRRSQSSGRPAPGDIYAQGEGPMRPGSQHSQEGSQSRAFPPRKSSLSQQQPPPEIQQYSVMGAPPVAQAPTPASEGKALPFIRPADIYRRMEEEREKERRSQESSRPSFESATSKIRESSVASHRPGSDVVADEHGDADPAEDMETARRLQPTLSPVAERKSEYGFENMINNAGTDRAEPLSRTETGLSKASEAASPSSDYTNRPDPISASTLNSRQTPFGSLSESPNDAPLPAPPEAAFLLPAVRGVSDFGNDMFGQRGELTSTSQPQPLNTRTAPAQESATGATLPARNLEHQNSLGYRSMVNQAFDQSQEEVPPTPISMSDSVARSNSASASDISPIMSRNYEPPTSQPPIPEETISRPDTSGTQSSLDRVATDKELPAPPALVAGYRRDGSPVSSINPDKQTLSLATADLPKSEHADMSADTNSTASWDKDSERDLVDASGPHMTDQLEPPSAGASTHLDQPPMASRSTSEDWREWETSRKQFKTQHGVQDSIPSTSGVPSPISRAETPIKGAVRDIAGKLENNSGRNSPSNLDPPRPSNARLDSFRPSLPGGWQSYTTNPGTATPQHEKKISETETIKPSEQDDIPTAGPPKDHSAFSGPQNTAFAAAVAAGTALAGAFGVSQMLDNKDQDELRDTGANNSGTSTSLSSYEREADETPMGQDRQLESIPEGDHRSPTSPMPPAPLPKDTPSETHAGQSTLDYFPAPLTMRQSRGAEQLTTPRPTLPATLSTETSPQDDDNDRLRKEIVKSLTPKSSQYEDPSRLSSAQNTFPVTSGSQRTVSTMGDSNLPREYDSYWDESNEEQSRKAAFETTTPTVPHVPESFEATAQNDASVPETTAAASSAEADMPPKAMLEQRFSWETAGEHTPSVSAPPRVDSLQDQSSPDTIKAATSTPASLEPLGSSEALRPAPSVKIAENKGAPQLVETGAAAVPAIMAGYTPNSSFRERPFKDVLALNSPQERIQVFKTHRQHYATTEDGGLAEWLQSVGRSHPEHSTVMSANGIPTLQDDGTELHRPSPARIGTKFRMPSSNYSGGNEASGTKQLQEDGKRLLKGAGKLGKMGGTTAKGLLAKGKDKFRTVSSSGDKGILQNRRRSSQLGLTATEEMPHSSHPPGQPPSVAPHLEIPPVNNDDWGLPYGSPRDESKSSWEGASLAATGEVARSHDGPSLATAKHQAARPESESFAAPAPFIGHVIPSNQQQGRELRDSISSANALATADHRTLKALEQSENQSSSTLDSHVPLAIAAAVPIAASNSLSKEISTGSPNLVDINSLAAPQDRLSVVSNMSSQSATQGEHRSRSISPPRRSISNQNDRQDTSAPPYTQHFPPTKTAEAEQERVLAEATKAEEPLPTYESPVVPGGDAKPRIEGNAQILPIADLSSQRRQETTPHQARPFSFAGPEALERMSTDAAAPPPVAIGETLNKHGTNVSVDEVNDDSDSARNRKSYSRPFGAIQEPNIHDHPALRNPDAIDRTQMYSTESPLPSARREQASPVPRQKPTGPREGDEGYRIPGPYVQEYRSPVSRQNIIPFDTRQDQRQTAQVPIRSPTASDRAGQGILQPNMAVLHGRDMGPPAQRPGQDRSKSRTFGSLFKREKAHHANEPNTLDTNKQEKRNSLFRSNSRQGSVSSQGSRLGSLAKTPSREQPHRQNSNLQIGGDRRSSKDMLGSSTGANDDEYGRKKRFSGIGGFFKGSSANALKGNPPQKSPMQHTAYQDTRQQQNQNASHQQFQRASTLGPSATTTGRPFTERPYHLQTTQPTSNYNAANNYQNREPPSNGYQYPASAFPHGPDSVMPGRADPGSTMHAPNQDRGFVQNSNGAFSAHPPQQNHQLVDQRPSDLRINTAPHTGIPTRPTPTTAAAMQARSPNNTYAHNFPSTRAPTSTGSTANARAIDLHKRSRSPKLGRQHSLEDLTQRHSHDPAAKLGTFSNKSKSPNTADREEPGQEKPWAISLPADADERRKGQPLQRSESAGNRGLVAELPGSKADGYESESPVEMSATAMPGSWEPSGYENWED